MPLEITLRTNAAVSPFRNRLLTLCSMPVGDKLILCSGYFQEGRNNYDILSDNLLRAIQSSNRIKEIELRGYKYGFGWDNNFRLFTRRLRRSGFQVKSLMAKKANWHAKIAVRIRRGVPIAAIIGSSNLTRPPFGVAINSWNFECDVTIWLNTRQLNRIFRDDRRSVADLPKDTEYVLQAQLTKNISQPNEEERLKQLVDQIESAKDEFREL